MQNKKEIRFFVLSFVVAEEDWRTGQCENVHYTKDMIIINRDGNFFINCKETTMLCLEYANIKIKKKREKRN